MLLIFCEHITPRVEYVLQFMLGEIGGFSISLTSDKAYYCESKQDSINYSSTILKQHELWIKPNEFLFDASIRKVHSVVEQDEKQIYLFIRSKFTDEKIFDPFAAAFFLLSRYEEYLHFTADIFGRFEANCSILQKKNLLQIPLINKWAEDLKKEILCLYPQQKADSKKFSAQITIDIDQAYAFKYRGLAKNILSFLKNLFFLKGSFLAAQIKNLLGFEGDPYDTFEFLRKMQLTYSQKFIYFINVGRYSHYDKNLSIRNQHFRHLIREIADYAEIGLHPSFLSTEQPSKFNEEKEALENVLGKSIIKSRQHFLKLTFPDTYKHLLQAGIKEDYTMGFATQPGFRAGTCTPFFWFDLIENKTTTLKVYPVTIMEGTLAEDLKMDPDKAQNTINLFLEIVRQYNGYFICIWHNHTVNDRFFWKGWKSVFETTLQRIKSAS